MGRKIGKQIRAICEMLDESGPQTKRQTMPEGMTKAQQGNHYRLISRGLRYGVLVLDDGLVSVAPNWRILIDRGEMLVNKRVAVVTVTGPVSVFDLGRV